MMYGYFRPGGVVWDVTTTQRPRALVCGQTSASASNLDRLLSKRSFPDTLAGYRLHIE
jgi:hypothetical protein